MELSWEEVRIGPFCVDLTASEVLKDGVPLDLRPQVFQTLIALAKHAGRYLDSDHLIDAAWSGNRVSKHTVAVTVNELKKALGPYGCWITYRPKFGYRLEIPPTEDLVKTGWHFASHRSREGLEKALACFEEAAAANSSDYGALHGIAVCHLLFGAYAMRLPCPTYARFQEAHRRAVAVAGLTPELRAERGHALHMFERRSAEAESEMLEAYRGSRRPAGVCVRIAMLYAAMGRTSDALDAIEEGRSVDPLCPALGPTETCVRFLSCDYENAVICGLATVELHPYLQLGRMYYAQALEQTGRFEQALDQHRIAGVMCPDLPWLRAMEGRCLALMGRTREAAEIAAELERLRQTEYIDAYYLSMLFAAMDQRDSALRELNRAHHEGSTVLSLLEVDPRMELLTSRSNFAAAS